MKVADAQNLFDNAYFFICKALVMYCPKTVVAHAYALLYRSEKITNLRFLCEKNVVYLEQDKGNKCSIDFKCV